LVSVGVRDYYPQSYSIQIYYVTSSPTVLGECVWYA